MMVSSKHLQFDPHADAACRLGIGCGLPLQLRKFVATDSETLRSGVGAQHMDRTATV